jgi:hypothetical protein
MIKKKKKQTKAMRKRHLIALWSKAVRKSWGGLCAICGKAGNQSHHYFGKKAHPSVMFEVINGIFCCFYCHIIRIHRAGDTEPARDALIDHIGITRFDWLKKKAKDSTIKNDLDEVESKLQHYVRLGQ